MPGLDDVVKGDGPTSAGASDGLADEAAAGQPSWSELRGRSVQAALDEEDVGTLRRISALPGGFGSNELRQKAWPVLLRTRQLAAGIEGIDGGTKPEDGGPDVDEATSVTEEVSETTEEHPDGAQKEDVPFEHPDEVQVGLDTKRSFVTYPRGIPRESKETMQEELHLLIVTILRKYPSLSYFQGFHDIMSVLYLTYIPLPPPPQPRSRTTSGRGRIRSRAISQVNSRTASPAPPTMSSNPCTDEASRTPSAGPSRSTSTNPSINSRATSPSRKSGTGQRRNATALPGWNTLLQCAEVVSVCRVRDGMGQSMDPMMGLLKILKRLLKVADPQLARFSSKISPVPTLPFFALSWILCLFSHDIDTLEPVQRMFDFLLARNPIAAIYLAVAILIAKKKQMFALGKSLGPEAVQDPSLLHPLFARLPPLYPDTPDSPDPPEPKRDPENMLDPQHEEMNPYDPIPLSRIFTLTDDLLARYPWDGPAIHGNEIMGTDSMVFTFDEEALPEFDLEKAHYLVTDDVILPGGTEPDEEDDEEEAEVRRFKPVRRLALPRNRLGTVVAVGVAVLGISVAMYGLKAGPRTGWTGWWNAVARSWVGRTIGGSEDAALDALHMLRQTFGRLS